MNNNVTSITIADKEYNLMFGMHAIEATVNIKAVNTGCMGIAKIIFGSLENYYVVQEQPTPLTFQEVYEWVEGVYMDDDPNGVLAGIAKAFHDSKAYARVMAKNGVLDKKKEQIPTETTKQ